MLFGYQILLATELFIVQPVQFHLSRSSIISKAGRKGICTICKEEILNGREVSSEDKVLCQSCVGNGYYNLAEIPKKVNDPRDNPMTQNPDLIRQSS
jgi:Formylmethanofuran dehydrogenase subunit E